MLKSYEDQQPGILNPEPLMHSYTEPLFLPPGVCAEPVNPKPP